MAAGLVSISAVTFAVADMEASVGFYSSLGFELLYGGPGASFSSFSVGSGYLNLQADDARPVTGRSWGRVVIWVSDVDEMYRSALQAGWRTETEPADAPWGERYFHMRDPDGNELSFARPIA